MNEQEEKQLTLFPEVLHANRLASPGKRGRLNPRFYEKLMGFPTGWTELDV